MGTSELLPYLNLHLGEHLHLCQIASQLENRRMPNGTYGGVRGRKTKVGRKLLRFPPTRLINRAFQPEGNVPDGIGTPEGVKQNVDSIVDVSPLRGF